MGSRWGSSQGKTDGDGSWIKTVNFLAIRRSIGGWADKLDNMRSVWMVMSSWSVSSWFILFARCEANRQTHPVLNYVFKVEWDDYQAQDSPWGQYAFFQSQWKIFCMLCWEIHLSAPIRTMKHICFIGPSSFRLAHSCIGPSSCRLADSFR